MRRFSFINDFNKLTFGRLFSLNLSSKSPWQSPVKTKFESYNLHHCKRNCHKLVLWVFIEQLFSHIIFDWLHCSEVTLVKKYKPSLQKKGTKIFDERRSTKKPVPSQREKNSGVLRLNQILSNLLTISKCLQLNFKKTQQLFAIVKCFWTCRAFSHFTFPIPLEV